MKEAVTEKRANKGYKVAHSYYEKAMTRASAEKTTLAGMIEQLVINYSSGKSVEYIDPIPVEEAAPKKSTKRKPKEKLLTA